MRVEWIRCFPKDHCFTNAEILFLWRLWRTCETLKKKELFGKRYYDIKPTCSAAVQRSIEHPWLSKAKRNLPFNTRYKPGIYSIFYKMNHRQTIMRRRCRSAFYFALHRGQLYTVHIPLCPKGGKIIARVTLKPLHWYFTTSSHASGIAFHIRHL